MKNSKSLLAVAVIIACCAIAVWFSTSIHGSQNTYELKPQLTIPEHKADIVRVIDAYERLMERYLDLTERNSAMIGEDIRSIAIRLDSIDDGLTDLSSRIARIERALGIKHPATPTGTSGKTETVMPERDSRYENPK